MSLQKLQEKKTKIEAALAEIVKKIAEARSSSIDLTRVVAGAVVTFTYGKGEGKKVLTGTVLGRKAAEKGAELVRLTVGEGFDAQTVTTFIANVNTIVSSPVPADGEESAQPDVLTAAE
jgi:hypothetical protein